MKGLIKLFSAAAFVGALASCSDDLSLNKSEGFIAGGDLYATLNNGDEATRMGVLENKDVVWSVGDQIKVYSPNALKSDSYDLDPASAGYMSGTFNLKVDNGVSSMDNLVAITSSGNQKDTKVFADEKGTMNLIAKIPAQFDQFEKTQAGGSILYWPLKVPYYGLNVSFNSDNSLNATMNPLAALLKIDIKALPANTRAIVLTTHYDSYIDENMTDEQLRTARTKTSYQARAEYLKGLGKQPALGGGKDEALSGTLTAKLVPGTKLVIDEDYVHADTIRINIDELPVAEDKIIFVPIVAQRYEKLTVLAVNKDSKEPYFWPNAEVLRVFENQEFEVTGRYTLAEAVPKKIDATNKTAIQLAIDIAELTLNDRAHTINVLVEGQLTNDADAKKNILYIANNIPGKSSVNIVFKDKQTFAFDIVEAVANFDNDLDNSAWNNLHRTPFSNAPASPYSDVVSQDRKRTVKITFAEGEANDHKIILPTSDVVVNCVDTNSDGVGIAAAATISIIGSNTKEVSGYTDGFDWNSPRNHTNAGIVINGSNAGTYEILAGHLGHIYAKGNGYDDEIALIKIRGTRNYPANIDLRITDMLVGEINYPELDDDAEGEIYTTGNAAIHTIKEGHSGHDNTIKVNASWTGKQLSIPALVRNYDQSIIFTAAQLQGMGRKTHMSQGTSPAAYEMSGLVRSVWLGGSLFPWIGADVSNPDGGDFGQSFTFDGKNTNLRNMVLDLYEPWIPVDCCCADNRVRVDANLGLISRVIVPNSFAKIKNVDLSDVIINTQNLVIPNIGAICGKIDAAGPVELTHNGVSSVRIDARGTNIGGAFGLVDCDAKVLVNDLKVIEGDAIYGKSWVESEATNVGGTIGAIVRVLGTNYDYCEELEAMNIYIKAQYVRSQDDNVGGQVGYIKTKKLNYGGAENITNNYVELDHEVYSDGGSNVGGLIGFADYKTWAQITKIRGTVFVRERIQADINEKKATSTEENKSGSNVGGLVGRNYIKNAKTEATQKTEIEGSVSTKVLKAENRNAGGFVGYYEADELFTDNKTSSNTVTISQLLEATEGYVGGLYGDLRWANNAHIGTMDDQSNRKIKVDVTEIAGAKAVGGLIGSTTVSGAENNKAVYVQANAKSKTEIDIDQWTITKYPWFFRTTGDRKMNGSFGTVIGWLNGRIKITDGATARNLKVEEKDDILKIFERDDDIYGGPDFKSSNPIFTEAKKVNLLFILQKISQSTEGVEYPFVVGGDVWASWWNSKEWVTGQGLWYWGDENGYVGVDNNSGNGGGSYYLNDVEMWGNVNYNLYYDWSTPIWQDELPINYSHD